MVSLRAFARSVTVVSAYNVVFLYAYRRCSDVPGRSGGAGGKESFLGTRKQRCAWPYLTVWLSDCKEPYRDVW